MAGKNINDHSFWAGSKSKESVFPMSAKMKQYSSAEGAGAVGHYEDTTETIKSQQEQGIRKANAHKQKASYRN